MRETRAPSGSDVVGSLLGATAIVLVFSRTETHSGHGDAIDGAIYYTRYSVWYFPREFRELVGRESSLFEPRFPGTAAWRDAEYIRDTTQTPPEISVHVDVALSGVALHLLAVAAAVFLGWRVAAHLANRWDASLASALPAVPVVAGVAERAQKRVSLDPEFDGNARSFVGPTWPRLLGTVALVALDAVTPDQPLLVEGIFGLVVEATRRLGVHGALFLGEIRIRVVVTFLTLFSILVTYLAICATVAALRVLESRLSTWRGSVG